MYDLIVNCKLYTVRMIILGQIIPIMLQVF